MDGLKVCLDVGYRDDSVVAALVAFRGWTDEAPAVERRVAFDRPAPSYEPGEFYRRELPYLLAALGALAERPALVIVDGYVWLDGGRPGLGAHLHVALERGPAVVGVAKRTFRDAAGVIEVLRGTSKLPLYVSAVGIEPAPAARSIATMHGPHRIPTLLRRVDQLSRGV